MWAGFSFVCYCLEFGVVGIGHFGEFRGRFWNNFYDI